MTHKPAFLVVATRSSARRLGARLSTHALTEVVSSVTEARALLRTHERWLGWWVEGLRDHDALLALWRSRAPGAPPPPVLLIGDTRPELDAAALPHRWLPKSAPRAEERYFLGYCLAYEVSGRGLVAAAVENLGREHELTARQMELTAISTLPQGRDDILRGLGVSPNTLKTRVRQLLRVLQHDTLDSLGKTVLRSALDLAPVPQTPHGVPLHVARPPLAGLLPAQRLPREVVEEVPVEPPVRKRPVAPASPSRALTWS
jgi:DNA-binding CsgD family transcriptional regulator